MSIDNPSQGLEEADWLVGGGRMGELIRSMNWDASPLGPRRLWPQSLRTTINLCLASNFPLCFTWGPDRIQIYNDGYWPICGAKHPITMGQDHRESWISAWPVIGPGFERCMATGETTFVTDTQIFLDRNGYLEETFFTYSYSPIRDETGGIGGIFNPVTETTGLVLSQRRLSALRAVGACTGDTKSVDEALSATAVALADFKLDLPLVLFYRIDSADNEARLVSAAGATAGEGVARVQVALDDNSGVPFDEVVRANRCMLLDDLNARFGHVRNATYPETLQQALVYPISVVGSSRPIVVMVAGISTRRALDDAYHQFYHLLASAVATAVANARSYEEERRRAEALSELDRAKTAFFSNVSHEFRTPLTLMLGPLEDVLGSPAGSIPNPIHAQIKLAHRNGLRLLKLVNALLDFSRLEGGRVEPTFGSTDLASLTQDLASTFRSLIEREGLEFVIDCPPLQHPVYVDVEMWEKVILNLLSNAFKFTLDGSIKVRLREIGGFVELSVIDTGVGIPAHELDRVFDRFHRIEGSSGRTYEGTGIGLSLVQELVKLHGGSVRVESTPDGGSTFIVRIPLGTEHIAKHRIVSERTSLTTGLAGPFVEEAQRWILDNDSTANLPADADLADRPRPRIVVADDNADMREYVTRLLSGEYAVTAVADGHAALKAVFDSPPDLVLSDVMMPRVDGFELLAKIRSTTWTRSVPVILVSARAGSEAKVDGLSAGADDYLVKPFSGKELLARVRATIETARLRQQAAQREQRELSMKEESARKDAFIAMLAHELRNPLGPIRNSVQILAIHRDAATTDRVREMIGRQVGHLARIVDDLLDISRVSQGKIELRCERVDLAQLAAQVTSDESVVIEAAGLLLEVHVPEIPVWVNGDRTRLTQVLSNLISNAVKFTDRGGKITVTVRGDRSAAALSVTDTGIGIEPALLPHLFESFAQADKTLARSRGGLGLGLAMVKGLVELHRGQVGVQTGGPGQGATFTVNLTRLAEPVALQPTLQPPERKPGAQTNRVLIVEDNRDAAESLKLLLEFSGCDVKVAYTGLEGVQAARQMVPDLVFCDIGLPGLNGYEVARQMRTEFKNRKLTLVALTGYGDESDQRRAADAGFDRHFTKPVDPMALAPLLAK